MKIQYVLSLIICMAGLLAASARPADASEILYDSSGFVRGQQSMEQSFVVSGPGTLTITLSNVDWPQSLASLNLLVSSTQGLLGPEMGAGTAAFKFSGGDIFAQWFGTAQGPLNTGVYGLEVVWNSASTTAPVPLPTSFALLLAGLLLLFWHRRGRVASGEMDPGIG
jgi:MYXO-CTERM domain-containing protein